jgi:hypothetical protein
MNENEVGGACGTWLKKRSAYRILVCKSLGKRPLKRLLDPENERSMTLQNVE